MATTTGHRTKVNMRDVTLKVKIIEAPRYTRYKFRLWLGIKIIWLATVVIGCRLKVAE